MRAHLVQLDIAWEAPEVNFRRVRAMLGGVAPGDLVVLPEMFDTGFSLNIDATADRGATLDFVRGLAKELHATVHGSRTVLAPGAAKARNVATIAGPDGSVLCEYVKVHPFSYGREPERFDGGSGVVLYEWRSAGGALGVAPAVCYDLRFPELFRLGLLRGAQMYAIGANWPASRQHHWRALLIARAVENQAFVLGVNRAGDDPNLRYAGGSIAVGPRGDVLGELGEAPGVLSVDIDPREVAAWRDTFPAWRDVKLIKA
ncbi:MAG: carbon-nitrogen family hydrolase [Phycisphaerales bacterium]|nr:carbon-nitrogen family hydrolase [Phycisphaerales bacterium]